MSKTRWYMNGNEWTLTQTTIDNEATIYFETVLSQANGHMGIRAYTEEKSSGESIREGYLAGVFSHLGPEAAKLVGDREFPTSEMISIPEIFACEVKLDGEVFNPAQGEISFFERSLNMKSGELKRHITWVSPEGNISSITFERFISSDKCSLACHKISITPLNWDGEAEICWNMNGTIPTFVRFGAKSFPQHPQHHLSIMNKDAKENLGFLHLKTRGTDHDVAIAARVNTPNTITDFPSESNLMQTVKVNAKNNSKVEVERFVSVVTSRDYLKEHSVLNEAINVTESACSDGYDSCLEKSSTIWQKRWKDADIVIDGPEYDQKVVRYNLFQLLQMAPWDSDKMSLAARALSFNRYRGTYFWDTETFILPFFSVVFPKVAQNLLAFRYNTLDGARSTAKFHKAAGALYPWMTEADKGEDHSLFRLTNMLWHQTADIAYAVGQYADLSGDIEFMSEKGLEILAETTRYWISKMEVDEDGIGHINGALGPQLVNNPAITESIFDGHVFPKS